MAGSEAVPKVAAGRALYSNSDAVLLSSSPMLPTMRSFETTRMSKQPLFKSSSDKSPARRTQPTSNMQTDTAKPCEFVVLDSTPASISGAKTFEETRSKYFEASQSRQDLGCALLITSPSSRRTETYRPSDFCHVDPRRQEWTSPPMDTVQPVDDRSSPPSEEWSSPTRQAGRKDVFKSLHTSFACRFVGDEASNALSTLSMEPSFSKGTQIEAIAIGGDSEPSKSNNTSPTKTTALKKKPRTLTELSVAAYMDVLPRRDGVLKGNPKPPETDVRPAPQKPTKRRKTAKQQPDVLDESVPAEGPQFVQPSFRTTKLRKLKTPASSSSTKRKATKRRAAQESKKPVLLSPRSALTDLQQQDFLFGTSSQLAVEQSPTFLRQLHDAMHESNQEERNNLLDLLADANTVDLTDNDHIRPKLWDAAWRHEDGNLSVDNVINLKDNIEFPEDPHQVIAMAQRAAEEVVPKSLDPNVRTAIQSNCVIKNAPKDADKDELGTHTLKQVSCKQNTTRSSIQAAKTKTTASQSAPTYTSSTQQPKKGPPLPDFNAFTTAELTKKVTAYGYKPMRGRSAMVALLSNCWAAQQHVSRPGQFTQSVPMSTTFNQCVDGDKPTQETPQRINAKTVKEVQPASSTSSPAVSRPSVVPSAAHEGIHSEAQGVTTTRDTTSLKKTEFNDGVVFEIEDSENELDGRSASPEVACYTASGDDGEGGENDSPDSSGDAADVSLAAEPTTEQTRLFEHITTAVIRAPASTDPAIASWHEKMLMYDTIILENFTAWLNDEGHLWRAGYDGLPATTMEVKKWCESKSVCCTWRNNLHGKERKL